MSINNYGICELLTNLQNVLYLSKNLKRFGEDSMSRHKDTKKTHLLRLFKYDSNWYWITIDYLNNTNMRFVTATYVIAIWISQQKERLSNRIEFIAFHRKEKCCHCNRIYWILTHKRDHIQLNRENIYMCNKCFHFVQLNVFFNFWLQSIAWIVIVSCFLKWNSTQIYQNIMLTATKMETYKRIMIDKFKKTRNYNEYISFERK